MAALSQVGQWNWTSPMNNQTTAACWEYPRQPCPIPQHCGETNRWMRTGRIRMADSATTTMATALDELAEWLGVSRDVATNMAISSTHFLVEAVVCGHRIMLETPDHSLHEVHIGNANHD